MQTLLDTTYLKASLELFENNLKDADVVNFQIIYDQRKNLAKKVKNVLVYLWKILFLISLLI